MNFLTPEQEMWRATVERFVEEEIGRDYIRKCDIEREYPYEAYEKVAKEGWLGILFPEESGGLGGDIMDYALMCEGLAKYGFDFSIFMKRGVPDLLRKKALQKFFNSNPVLANLDGLNDYDEDFNNPLHMVYKSSWDVGRGFLTEAEKILQQATGRLTRDEPIPEVAAADMAEELDAHAAETAVSSDPDADAGVPADAGAEAAMPDEAEPTDAQLESEHPDTEPPQQKRVSIRQRLNG